MNVTKYRPILPARTALPARNSISFNPCITTNRYISLVTRPENEGLSQPQTPALKLQGGKINLRLALAEHRLTDAHEILTAAGIEGDVAIFVPLEGVA